MLMGSWWLRYGHWVAKRRSGLDPRSPISGSPAEIVRRSWQGCATCAATASLQRHLRPQHRHAIDSTIARALVRSRALMVYEVLDIQRISWRSSNQQSFPMGQRRLLGTSDVLVVSSPDFVSEYFARQQGFYGCWRLLENKVSPHRLPRSAVGTTRNPHGPPWVIGWFGVLRCVEASTSCAASPTRSAIECGYICADALRTRICPCPPSRLPSRTARTWCSAAPMPVPGISP